MISFIVKPNKTIKEILAKRDLSKALSKSMPAGEWKATVNIFDTAMMVDDYKREMTQKEADFCESARKYALEDGATACGLCHLGTYHSSESCSIGVGIGWGLK